MSRQPLTYGSGNSKCAEDLRDWWKKFQSSVGLCLFQLPCLWVIKIKENSLFSVKRNIFETGFCMLNNRAYILGGSTTGPLQVFSDYFLVGNGTQTLPVSTMTMTPG